MLLCDWSSDVCSSDLGNVASLILLKFGEATPYEVDALMAAGLILFALTLLVNAAADFLINRLGSKGR